MKTHLILSIDRRNDLPTALSVVDLAVKYRLKGVVGIDLCGDPAVGDISIFEPAFHTAHAQGLKITIHFAEAPQSSSDKELWKLLSYKPDRIGHVINVSDDVKREIVKRKLGLELCLSCNVHAKMITGTYSDHHFGWWRETGCPIALSVCDRPFSLVKYKEIKTGSQIVYLGQRTPLICGRPMMLVCLGAPYQTSIRSLQSISDSAGPKSASLLEAALIPSSAVKKKNLDCKT